MSSLFRIFAVVGALLLLGITGAAAYASLKGCAVNLSFLSDVNGCPSATDLERRDELERLRTERVALKREILEAEEQLAERQCVAELPNANAPLPERAWAQDDVPTLYGCWSLGSEYQTRDVDTKKIISYPSWNMCFDANGQGKQVMRGDDGSTCEGPVQARINDAKQLILGEGGNLTCNDGGYIHRRDIACSRTEGGAIACGTLQPETKGAATVPLTRLR